ncbi:hypothetical protein E2986_05410 [Frieseomelitta varia]|uniref:Uncharacterized protein n=1 Tax=Frieseomelitta varia TaxID=561572 RepID=A0A833SMF1_9HYME|nr:hypothetical protein E2986_05410 [Frieseomelitta varia]
MAMRRKSQMQTLGANNIYGVAGNPLGIQGRPSRSSQISVKDVFEGHANSAYEPDENTGSSLRLHNLGQSEQQLIKGVSRGTNNGSHLLLSATAMESNFRLKLHRGAI